MEGVYNNTRERYLLCIKKLIFEILSSKLNTFHINMEERKLNNLSYFSLFTAFGLVKIQNSSCFFLKIEWE